MARILLGSPGGSPPTRRWRWCAWLPRPGIRCGSSRRRRPSASWARPPSRASPARPCWSTSSSATPPAAPSPATRPPTTTRSPIWSWCAAATCSRSAGLGQHARQAGRRPRRQPAHQRRAGQHRAAGARPGDEQPHVGARGHAGQPGDPARARRARGGARDGPAGLRGRVGGGPPGRSRRGLRGHRVRAGTPAPSSCWAAACWSPPAAPASRSTPCASSATALRAGWAWRWPPRPPAGAPR